MEASTRKHLHTAHGIFWVVAAGPIFYTGLAYNVGFVTFLSLYALVMAAIAAREGAAPSEGEE